MNKEKEGSLSRAFMPDDSAPICDAFVVQDGTIADSTAENAAVLSWSGHETEGAATAQQKQSNNYHVLQNYDEESNKFIKTREEANDEGAPAPSSYWGRFNYPVAQVVATREQQEGEYQEGVHHVIASAEVDDRQIRHAFIRKVYLILAAQMLLTFGVCAVMTLHKPLQTYVLEQGMPLYWASVLVLFVSLFALFVYKREYPINFLLLGVFTLAMSYSVGMITAMYDAAGYSGTIIEAVFITATVFLVLTIFTLQSKWDFSFLGAGLGMGLWILLLWSILGIIFGFQTGYVYALAGSVLFSGYIIFDTYMLAERHDPQDYVVAAIELYLDIVNLFLFILRLLSESDR
uniref:Transmembrane BAX inhibitor motif-containing protein 4 n=1 Tax=Helicotheca tamesis TaxID=374047 RepID=A0A7S2MGN5_9STRA|mmetsp:Transcript_15869/g.21776  ORF Transcript_15869/g.21776 Transcript_15869/m.21776 type:complete len:347 (+) Transcript_15869:125-1165(+)|eukprot:CAMPEP_0185726272 /NCGR_PEP_ID=MMETSP1171-20130828/2304_1 /TAXON_ID=374046 /ORGANISM="Helicotheca tamensis, Strain CCMP826" /LENGTH=346 /DNA_ID=CAMNT_0028394591 /DNA_START=77 /DNA_END=1117 /DNA_ORIENTATION=-